MQPVDLLLTFLLFLFVGGRYFAISGALYWLCWMRYRDRWSHRRVIREFPPRDIIHREIQWSLVTSLLFAIAGTVTYRLWEVGKTKIYLDPAEYGWWWLVASLPVLLVIHDTYFYWTHRLLHWRPLYVRVHRVHHESRNPSPWAAFSFHPLEAIVQAVLLPVLVTVLPVYLGVFGLFLLVMTVMGTLNHLGYELFPRAWLEHPVLRHVISATHHTKHHQKTQCNYGLYFTFWDLLLTTEDGLPRSRRERYETNAAPS